MSEAQGGAQAPGTGTGHGEHKGDIRATSVWRGRQTQHAGRVWSPGEKIIGSSKSSRRCFRTGISHARSDCAPGQRPRSRRPSAGADEISNDVISAEIQLTSPATTLLVSVSVRARQALTVSKNHQMTQPVPSAPRTSIVQLPQPKYPLRRTSMKNSKV